MAKKVKSMIKLQGSRREGNSRAGLSALRWVSTA